MKAYMDYSTPLTIIESGQRAYRLGIKKSDCPIDSRTGANKICWWNDGWDLEAEKTCKGENCTAKRGVGHSDECEKEHDETECPEIFSGTLDALKKISIFNQHY